MAEPHVVDRVYGELVAEAVAGGAIALRGRLDPRYMYEMRRRWLVHAGNWTLVHSRHDEVLNHFRNGTAWFTGLEGEEWMRFMHDSLDI